MIDIRQLFYKDLEITSEADLPSWVVITTYVCKERPILDFLFKQKYETVKNILTLLFLIESPWLYSESQKLKFVIQCMISFIAEWYDLQIIWILDAITQR